MDSKNNNNVNVNIKKIAIIAMLSALAYLLMFALRIPFMPAAPFLKYDPKDVIIITGGFLFGPFTSVIMSVIVSFLEMVTVSESGPIGMIMNIVSSCSFAFTAAAIYKKRRTIRGAVAGLVIGLAVMIATMLLWNYLLTPLYMKVGENNVPREFIVKMLVPVFLPFNLLKGGLNLGLTLLIYKPLTTALRKTGMLPKTTTKTGENGKANIGVILAALFAIATYILLMLVFSGVI